MEVELAEIRDFLKSCPPFDTLPAEVLDRLPRMLTVEYLRRGSPFPPPASEACAGVCVLRSGAVEFRDQHGHLAGMLAERDVYAEPCLEQPNKAGFEGSAAEDSLLYVLPCARFQALQQEHPEFDLHFHESMRVRLNRAVNRLAEPEVTTSSLFHLSLAALLAREPVWATPDVSIREAAQLMSKQRVSALLIMESGRLAGLVTDRDLRNRCLAEGLGSERPVAEIMTRELHTLPAAATGFDALMTMARLNVHHLPVMDGDRVRGLVSNTDLIRQQSSNVLYLADHIRKCASVAAIQETCARLPALQVRLMAAGTSAYHLGQLIGSVTDAATVRLLELSEARLGAPPVPYAWLAVASQARQEQTVHSDQDNALLLADEYRPERDGEYFRALANDVNDGLDGCGFRYCPGAVMARTDQWRQPLQVWRGYFRDWIARPSRHALMLCANFFDMRPLAGARELFVPLQREALAAAQGNEIFLAHLAEMALEHRPPLGFFRNLVVSRSGEHARTLDLKLGGLVPIVDLARIHALAGGSPALNTCERLRAAAASATLSRDGAANLEDAFALIGTLRARHQAQQIRQGAAPDNFVPPDELTGYERSHLKDAFAAVRELQSVLAERYQTERFLK